LQEPSIATQFNFVDNTLLDISAVVLFDRYYTATGDWDAIGLYNLQAVSNTLTNWHRLNIAVSNDNEMECNINFDPTYNNFLVTYYNATSGVLPYIVNGINLTNPDTWTVISPGYNDSPNLSYPYPKVEINAVVTKVAHVWWQTVQAEE